jgi:hypothetical protein
LFRANDGALACSAEHSPQDQRGVNRCFIGLIDMGAVELQNPEVMIFRNGFERGG